MIIVIIVIIVMIVMIMIIVKIVIISVCMKREDLVYLWSAADSRRPGWAALSGAAGSCPGPKSRLLRGSRGRYCGQGRCAPPPIGGASAPAWATRTWRAVCSGRRYRGSDLNIGSSINEEAHWRNWNTRHLAREPGRQCIRFKLYIPCNLWYFLRLIFLPKLFN